MIDLTYTDDCGQVIAVSGGSFFVPDKGDHISLYCADENKQVDYQVLFRSYTEKGHKRSDGILCVKSNNYVCVVIEKVV